MSEGKPGRGSDQFPLRLPDGMRERIKAAADAAGRSMNAEIVATLEEKYPAKDLQDAFERLVYSLGKRIRAAESPEQRRIEMEVFADVMRQSGLSEKDVRYWLARVDVK